MSALRVFLVASLASAQQLTFDASTVKPHPAKPPDSISAQPPGGPGSSDPGRVHYTWMTLKNLLMTAYDVKAFQISGPDWLATARFEVEATMPPSTTKDQFRIMLQNLLLERFKITLHRETKDLPLYQLVVAKGGLKMKESTDGPPDPEPEKRATDSYGFPILPAHGRARMMELGMKDRARLAGYQQTTQNIADHLGLLNRPVIDATGLTAKYDFTLTFSLEGLGIAPPPTGTGGPSTDIESPPDIFTALQSQLGLKLEAKKGLVEMIVIDRIEKTPIGN